MESDVTEIDYNKLISLGYKLHKALSDIYPIQGIHKLQRKIHKETLVLEKVKQLRRYKNDHLNSTNLHHYEAFVNRILQESTCDSVLKHFVFEDGLLGRKKICVDLVTNLKSKWVKVIARNPKALSLISQGDGAYQQKSIIDHANEYLECALQNPSFYKPPLVEFYFASGIEIELAETLNSIGVLVSGRILGLGNDSVPKLVPLRLNRELNKINLDVSTMIAYVSALTNGNANKKVRGEVLSKQAESERTHPVKGILDNVFRETELFACVTAVSSFKSIVDILGGEGEKKRADKLLSEIKVVKDVPNTKLEVGGKIKPRALAVFGTGQAIKALTVTANSAFVRAALTQGVHFEVFIHQSRALTERKEILKE